MSNIWANLLTILVGGLLVNNFVMNRFLGCCPFLGVSKQYDTAKGMSMAVIFVMTLASFITWFVQHLILVPLHLEYMQTIAFILVIAVLVGIVEMALKKISPSPVSVAGRVPAAHHHQLRGAGRGDFERG